MTYTTSATTANNVGGVLTGGTWRAEETGGGATVTLRGAGITQIATGTTVELSGAGANINVAGTNLQDTLNQNDGNLKILNGQNFVMTNALTNNGTAEVGGSGALVAEYANLGNIIASSDGLIGAGDSTNSGTISVLDDAATLIFAGNSFTNNADGMLAGVGQMDFESSLTSTMINDGGITPGLSAGQLDFNGDILFGVTSLLDIELGGIAQGGEYDFLNALDSLTLDGDLQVNLIGGFEPMSSQSFTILSANMLDGNFAGLLDGAMSTTNDGLFSFQINYADNNVVLSNFAVVIPEPGSMPLVSFLFLISLATCRRRLGSCEANPTRGNIAASF